jgi:tetratricopeptide (TPR) repeat protein
MDYTAVGQTTHIAARMEQMALPGSILLTAETLSLAEGYVDVKSLGPLPVKGLEAPLEVYELGRAAAIRSRFQAAAARGLTRFVGRQNELEHLGQALERARAGHGQVVALVGEPGVGKSRLVWEVTHSHRTPGWLIVQTGSVSYGKAMPWLPVIDLLKRYFQIEERDDERKVREKVMGRVLALDEALSAALDAIIALLDVRVESSEWQALDPPQRRQRTLDALRRLIVRESQAQPVLVVFENLHWIDCETQAFLDSVVESLPSHRILLLVNYRPEYEHRWGGKTYYTQLRLDPLTPESASELLDALLGQDPNLRPTQRLLIERTEGNPFFLEESVRTLVETRALTGERGEVLSTVVDRFEGELAAERFGMGLPASVVTRVWLAFSLADTGRFAEGSRRALEALRLWEAVAPQPYSEWHAWVALGRVDLVKGELGSATLALERAARVARDGHFLVQAAAVMGYLGYAYLLAGRASEALGTLEDAVAQDKVFGFAFRYLHMARLAEARLRGGEPEPARSLIDRALELCQRHHQRGHEAEAFWTLGEIAYEQRDVEQGPRAPHDRHDDVPRDGDAVLARAGTTRPGRARLTRRPTTCPTPRQRHPSRESGRGRSARSWASAGPPRPTWSASSTAATTALFGARPATPASCPPTSSPGSG